MPDSQDQCPGEPDIDSDEDGVLNCLDGCPNDPGKTEPGRCGCGIPDTDTDGDGDGIPDCQDSSDSQPGTDLATYYREVRAGTTLADFELVSFYLPPPYIQAPQTLNEAMQGDYNRKNHRIGGYDTGTGGYIECDKGLKLVSGRAYWFLARHGMTIHYTGPAQDLNQKFALPLDYQPDRGNGWNLIGPPRMTNYEWQNLEVLVYDKNKRLVVQSSVGDLAPDNSYIDLRLWCWEGGWYRDDGQYLIKGHGCWVKARRIGVVLVFGPQAMVSDDAVLTAGMKRQHRRLLDWLTPSTALADTDGPPPPPAPFDETASRSARVDKGGGSCFVDALQ